MDGSSIATVRYASGSVSFMYKFLIKKAGATDRHAKLTVYSTNYTNSAYIGSYYPACTRQTEL